MQVTVDWDCNLRILYSAKRAGFVWSKPWKQHLTHNRWTLCKDRQEDCTVGRHGCIHLQPQYCRGKSRRLLWIWWVCELQSDTRSCHKEPKIDRHGERIKAYRQFVVFFVCFGFLFCFLFFETRFLCVFLEFNM